MEGDAPFDPLQRQSDKTVRHCISRAQNLTRGNPPNLDALRPKPFVAPLVPVWAIIRFVSASIDFHREPGFDAVEVQDEGADGMLAPEDWHVL